MVKVASWNYRIITRATPLARAQGQLAKEAIEVTFPQAYGQILTTPAAADKQQAWNLARVDKTGVFTGELEQVLLEGQADVAVHSLKDLPFASSDKLRLAGVLGNGIASDTLVLAKPFALVRRIGTCSPRRAAQLKRFFPKAEFLDLRGSVETRLEKVARLNVDATVLATIGLKRLKIKHYDHLTFHPLPLEYLLPPAGQGLLALQVKANDTRFDQVGSSSLLRAAKLERAILQGLGGGCHRALAVCLTGEELRLDNGVLALSFPTLTAHPLKHSPPLPPALKAWGPPPPAETPTLPPQVPWLEGVLTTCQQRGL